MPPGSEEIDQKVRECPGSTSDTVPDDALYMDIPHRTKEWVGRHSNIEFGKPSLAYKAPTPLAGSDGARQAESSPLPSPSNMARTRPSSTLTIDYPPTTKRKRAERSGEQEMLASANVPDDEATLTTPPRKRARADVGFVPDSMGVSSPASTRTREWAALVIENVDLFATISNLAAQGLHAPNRRDKAEWFNDALKAGMKAMIDSLNEDPLIEEFGVTTTINTLKIKHMSLWVRAGSPEL